MTARNARPRESRFRFVAAAFLIWLTVLGAGCGRDGGNDPASTTTSSIVLAPELQAVTAKLESMGYRQSAVSAGPGTFFGVAPDARRQLNVTLQKDGAAVALLFAEVPNEESQRKARAASLAQAAQLGFREPVTEDDRWYMNQPRTYAKSQRDYVGWFVGDGLVFVALRTEPTDPPPSPAAEFVRTLADVH